MSTGYQANSNVKGNLYAWAVQSGNVGTAVVPIPAAVWLFGSGLIGLIGLTRRKKA
ncbi:MAG TPA: VPLPA-CTERM sorting domain-containing protein [Gammaproteobacteria bacterium]|nr:VPLPA-CTERM sorting domain-containing protein [Gammaproteobacteria bacterium]